MSIVQQLANLVRLEAQRRPDVTYPTNMEGCYYRKGNCSDGSVGCLLGQMAKVLDINIKDYYDQGGGTQIDDVLENYIEDGDDEYINWLLSVQRAQDKGKPWGECISLADGN